MSGVVYGLLGYFWMQGRYNARFRMILPRHVVVMMLAWFALCWSGLIGHIANMAHTAGLLLGATWGYGAARLGRP
jgi:GlpG protein